MSLAPLHRRSIRRLLFAYGVNQLGDWAGELALAVVVFALTRSVAAVAVTWIAHRAVLALAAPLLAGWLERRLGLRVLPALYVVQAAVFAGLVAGSSAGLVAILPLVALDGLLSPAARAMARAALVAQARPIDLLRETNALVNLVFTLNGVLAPVLGGVLIAAVGPQAALATNAASFLVAAVAVTRVAMPRATGHRQPGGRHLRDALAYVRASPTLARLLAGDAIVMLFISAFSPVEVAFITGTLGQSNAALGAVMAAWGAGMVAGGAAAARLRDVALPNLLGVATFALAISCLGVAASTSLGTVLAWSIVGGMGNGAYGMTLITAIQQRTADAYQVRVGALYETVAGVAPGLGFVLGGVVAATTSARAVYLLAGIGLLATPAWAAAALRTADGRGFVTVSLRPGRPGRAVARRPRGVEERVDVVRAVVAASVDEERWRAGDPALVGARHVLADARGVLAPAKLARHAVGVEPELGGVVLEVLRAQLALMVEEDVVHVPEATLRGGGLRGLRGELRVRMHVVERKVAPDVPHVVVER
jgi:hypothetical protein